MNTRICGICRHEEPGHEPDCPVLTGAPVPGALSSQFSALQRQSMQGGLSQPESAEATFQRVTLAKLSAIQSDVAKILELLAGEKPSAPE